MEANVDIQKLQILNDRITQALEALDQVRLSVHSVSHTPAIDPWTAQQMQARAAFPGSVSYGIPYWTSQPQFSSIQHTVPTQSFVPSYGTMPMQVLGQPIQPGLLHTSPELLQQRMLEARYATDPVRLSQTFPYLNVPRFVQGIF